MGISLESERESSEFGREFKFADSIEFWGVFQPGGILKFRNSI